MTHFTVLVVADTESELEAALLPYHEYECTGIEEYTEWVIGHPAERALDDALKILGEDWVDENPAIKAKYETYISTDNLGDLFYDWDGTEEDEDGNYGRRTNPNAKWDWWVVGGRWTGLLMLKPGDAPTNIAGLTGGEIDFLVEKYESRRHVFDRVVSKYEGRETEITNAIDGIANGTNRPATAINGQPGVFGHVNEDPMRADSAWVEDVDWFGIAARRLKNHMDLYDRWHECLDDIRHGRCATHFFDEGVERAKKLWDDRTNCHEHYKSVDNLALSLAASSLFTEKGYGHLFLQTFEESSWLFYDTREEYMERFKIEALTHAFIDKDGKWNQRSEMGWFGMSDPESGTEDYNVKFWEFIESLNDDDRVWVVDCHI